MAYHLIFNQFSSYDAGQPGITIPVTLSLVGVQVLLNAKIDTGASECIFARQYGENLGLDIESGELIEIGTATGIFQAFRHPVILKILGYEFDVRVCFAANEFFDRNVLGRHGFLDRIQIAFIDYEGKLYLSELDEE